MYKIFQYMEWYYLYQNWFFSVEVCVTCFFGGGLEPRNFVWFCKWRGCVCVWRNKSVQHFFVSISRWCIYSPWSWLSPFLNVAKVKSFIKYAVHQSIAKLGLPDITSPNEYRMMNGFPQMRAKSHHVWCSDDVSLCYNCLPYFLKSDVVVH